MKKTVSYDDYHKKDRDRVPAFLYAFYLRPAPPPRVPPPPPRLPPNDEPDDFPPKDGPEDLPPNDRPDPKDEPFMPDLGEVGLKEPPEKPLPDGREAEGRLPVP